MVAQTNYGSRAMKDRVYTPRPLPTNTEDFNAYFADEFSYLGGFIDKMLSGQSIPYRSELPARVKDGMVIYFKNAIRDLQNKDVIKYIIPAPGLYVFKGDIDPTKPVGGSNEPVLRGGEWLRLIEDPESLRRNLTAYISVPKTSGTPAKPPANKYKTEDINPWGYTVPAELSDRQVFSSVAIDAVVGENPSVSWSDATPYNQVGRPGAGFYTHSSSSINSWPTNASDLLAQEAGRPPISGDLLTISNSTTGYCETKKFDGVNWNTQDVLFNGDVIAQGTISGDKIVAGAEIKAPKLTSAEIQGGSIVGGNIIGEVDLKIGKGGPFEGYNFHVNKNGEFFANGGTFLGSTNLENGAGLMYGDGQNYVLIPQPQDDIETEVLKFYSGYIPAMPFDRLFDVSIQDQDISNFGRKESPTSYADGYLEVLDITMEHSGENIARCKWGAHIYGIDPGFPPFTTLVKGCIWLPNSSQNGHFPTSVVPHHYMYGGGRNVLVPAGVSTRFVVERSQYWMKRTQQLNVRCFTSGMEIAYSWKRKPASLDTFNTTS